MKKSDIDFHSDRGPAHPAINIKCHRFISIESVMERFKCCRETAEKASRYAWESAIEQFWEEAPDIAKRYLKSSYDNVYSEGRSGGWLVVHGMAPVDSWDGPKVIRWGNFAKAIRCLADYLSSSEWVFDTIEANEWAQADALLDDPESEAEEVKDWANRDTMTET
jgi:hypothetical protein